MGSNSLNEVSEIVEIEDDVIDLDEAEKTPEEVIYEWDAKIRKKLSMFSVADNENILGDLMKEYLVSLEEMSRSYEDNETLKNKVYCHISFLYSYYVELQCCTPDNYLSNMEDILTLYCNLEIEVIRPLKKRILSKHKYKKRVVTVARRMVHVLTVYLLERHDHILHVLIKMNTSKTSDPCSEVLNILYTHFLTKVPAFNLCDESFCRNYLVFQKWKEIRKVEDWEGMDKIMYKMFKRTPDSIKKNEALKQILMPTCTSTVDIVLNLFRSFRAISSAYFKHVVAKRNIEMDDLDFNIDLGEDEPTIPVNDDNEEEVQFLKAYYEVERNMSNLSRTINGGDMTEIDIFAKCKEEVDEDDDVQFVGITMLPKQPVLRFTIPDEESDCTMSNVISEAPSEVDRISPSSATLLLNTTRGKTPDLDKLNGLTTICVGSPRTVPESPDSCQSQVQTTSETPFPALSSGSETIAPCEIPTETNQPEVSFVSKVPNLPSPARETDSENTINKVIEMKSVEVQADNPKNYVYNDYGLTTPPFEVQIDEQSSRPVEPRLYTNIGQNCEKKVVSTRSVEVQVDPPSSPYNDYGLTPPNDTHLEDHSTRLQEPLYTSIGRKNDEILPRDDVAQLETESHESEFDELDMSETTNVDVDEDTEEIDVESCHEADKEISSSNTEVSTASFEIKLNPQLQVSEESLSRFKTNDQIDTGQETKLKSAPNISPVTADSETKDLPETNNGSTILKPLVSSNRTNGQASSKIIYTSPQKIRPATLDDFSRFENAINSQWSKMKENRDFEDVLSGPISKAVPSLLSPHDKLDLFGQESNSKVVNSSSRSNSPNDMKSPAYEGIDDFRNYYSDSVNGRVPPPHDVRVPPGILKKTNSTGTARRKNHRIMFHESTCDNSEEQKARSDSVTQIIRRDRKLKMVPKVVVERLSFIENKMKQVYRAQTTIRVDYDKACNGINASGRDVVRQPPPSSPPRYSWIINFPSSRRSSGKVDDNPKEKNLSSCCDQLAEEFTKLVFNVSEDKALNLTILDPPALDPEFSNSPTFLQDADELVKHCLEETEAPSDVTETKQLLCDNSNFYTSQTSNENLNNSGNNVDNNSESGSHSLETVDDSLLQLPTAVPESYDFEKNLKNEVFSKIDWQNLDDSDGETRLPLKKRKLSVANEEQKKEEISYPATPMISIAEVEALHPRKLQNNARPFKTPAERKEMPPLPVFCSVDSDPSPIITDQFNINNHTYNNPTINYHMNNVPVPFINIPCGSYYSLPPILVPFNNVSTFEHAKQQDVYTKKENKKQGRQRKRQ